MPPPPREWVLLGLLVSVWGLCALSSELGRGVRRNTQHCGPTVAHLGDCRRVAQPPRLGLPAWLRGPALGAALSHHPAVAGSFWAAS